jgi:hypothetical protein
MTRDPLKDHYHEYKVEIMVIERQTMAMSLSQFDIGIFNKIPGVGKAFGSRVQAAVFGVRIYLLECFYTPAKSATQI